MVADSIIGVGILGSLNYNERQHDWAFELGQWLGALIIAFMSDLNGDMDIISLRRQIMASIERILSSRSLHLTTYQLWASCDNDAIQFGKRLLEYIKSLEGSTACALVIIGQCTSGMRSHILFAGQERAERMMKENLRDIEHYCPDIGIATEALGFIFLQQSAEDLGTSGINRLLVKLSHPLRVLIMSSDPRDAKQLRREFEQAIRQTRFRDSLRLHNVLSCRVHDIADALDTHNPNILHFSGHGTQSGLCFENDQGEVIAVNKPALASLLGMQSELKIVILNACYSQDQAQAVADAVGYVISMEGPILVKDSTVFSREFYRALCYGRTFEEAFNRARAVLGLTSTAKVHLLKKM